MATVNKSKAVVLDGDSFTDKAGNSKTAAQCGHFIIKATDGTLHRAKECT